VDHPGGSWPRIPGRVAPLRDDTWPDGPGVRTQSTFQTPSPETRHCWWFLKLLSAGSQPLSQLLHFGAVTAGVAGQLFRGRKARTAVKAAPGRLASYLSLSLHVTGKQTG